MDILEYFKQLIGQDLTEEDITPDVSFITALIIILMGVILADKIVHPTEHQQFQNLMQTLVSPSHPQRKLYKQITQAIQSQKRYEQVYELWLITKTLRENDKLVLLCFGYQMAILDEMLDNRENEYLEEVAQVIRIHPTYPPLIKSLFLGEEINNQELLNQFQNKLTLPNSPILTTAYTYIKQHIHPILNLTPRFANSIDKFIYCVEKLSDTCLRLVDYMAEGINATAFPNSFETDINKAVRKVKLLSHDNNFTDITILLQDLSQLVNNCQTKLQYYERTLDEERIYDEDLDPFVYQQMSQAEKAWVNQMRINLNLLIKQLDEVQKVV